MPDGALHQYREILRHDLSAFIVRSFLELNPSAKFLHPPYLELLADRLEKVRRREITRLIINLPPRSLKSHCVSIAFPAWILGHDPCAQIIAVSYGQELADKLARDCRTLMTSPFFEALFPTRLSPQKQATAEFETTARGYRLSTSVGGALTGRGADLIIVDDPSKPGEAISESPRQAVNDWYSSTLCSRLNDKTKGAIIIVQQRVHEDDLVGHLLRQQGWEVLSLPAIAERDEEFEAMTPYGKYRYRRKTGEALHPERESLAALEVVRQEIGSYNFAAQFQQTPAPFGGGMIQQAWFRFYDRLPDKFDRVIQSWDTANVAAALNSYTVCTTWGEKDYQLYLLDVFRQRLNYPDLRRAVRERAASYRADVVLIEYQASGVQLYQELARDGIRGITKYEPKDDKTMRFYRQVPFIESGAVQLPRQAGWLPDYLHELLAFPKGTYDDQADSTSQALDWIKQNQRMPALIEYCQYELNRRRGLGPDGKPIPVKRVRMRGAPNITHYYTSGVKYVTNDPNGRRPIYNPNAEGVIENVHPEDAEQLKRAGCVVIGEED
jgi:predicted phage terminase large subunit-like protein